jgi:Tol biopolymer transport system component
MKLEDRIRESIRKATDPIGPSPDAWLSIERRLQDGRDGPSMRQRVVVGVVALLIMTGAGFLVWKAFGGSPTLPAGISPGDRILFSVRSDQAIDTDVVALSGTKIVQPFITGPTIDSGASLSPDGGQVVFSRDGDIFVTNVDGTGVRQLTRDGGNDVIWDDDPVWSPDGTRIAYESELGGHHRIWVIGADGSDPHPITDAAYATQPAWSPDGGRIAYAGVQHGDPLTVRYEIYTVNVDGSGLLRLTRDERGESDPSWSPDSSRIAFVHRGGTSESSFIWSMASDGSDVTRVTGGRGYDTSPIWSPDGSRIVFTSDRSLSHRGPMTQTGDDPVTSSVFMVAAEGGPLSSIAALPGGGQSTSWSSHVSAALPTIDTTETATGTFRFSHLRVVRAPYSVGLTVLQVQYQARWTGDGPPRPQACALTLTNRRGHDVVHEASSFSSGQRAFSSEWPVRREPSVTIKPSDIAKLSASIVCSNPRGPSGSQTPSPASVP